MSADCGSDKRIAVDGVEQLYKSVSCDDAADVTYTFTNCGVATVAAGAQAVSRKRIARRNFFIDRAEKLRPYISHNKQKHKTQYGNDGTISGKPIEGIPADKIDKVAKAWSFEETMEYEMGKDIFARKTPTKNKKSQPQGLSLLDAVVDDHWLASPKTI